MIRGKEGHGRETLDEVWGRDVFYHRTEPENPCYLQIMIALFRLVSNEEEGEEIVTQFFPLLVTIRGMYGRQYGDVSGMHGWVGRTRERKQYRLLQLYL